MTTSNERFEEEIRELALLVQGPPVPAAAKPPRSRGRLTSPGDFVEAWAWWRRPRHGAPRPGAARP